MSWVPAQGKGRDGLVKVGTTVKYNGRNYSLSSLGGGSHQHAAIKDDAGYTYNVDTMNLSNK